MKKQYISPVCEVVKVNIGSLLNSVSVGSDGSLNVYDITEVDGEMDDIGGGGSSHGDFWGD